MTIPILARNYQLSSAYIDLHDEVSGGDVTVTDAVTGKYLRTELPTYWEQYEVSNKTIRYYPPHRRHLLKGVKADAL